MSKNSWPDKALILEYKSKCEGLELELSNMKRLNEEYESWEVEFWQELEKYITESKDLAAKLQHKEIEFRLKTEELKRAIEKLEFKNKDYLNQNRSLNEMVIK